MSAAQIEELVDETTLQDLDWSPPCELPHVHHARQVPLCPAEEAVTLRPPCGCDTEIVLMCLGCDQWLEAVAARCDQCGRIYTWRAVVVDRVPL